MKNMFRSRWVLVFVAVLLMGGAAALLGSASSFGQDKNAEVMQDVWAVRCSEAKEDKPASCEVFQKLSVKKTSQRVAEFAIGFPDEGGGKKGNARGVIVLPLGILLTEDTKMQIDERKPVSFKMRYCTNGGCFAFVNLSKGLLDDLRQGSDLKISGKAMNGKNMEIKMSLRGLGKALDKIQF